MQLKSIYLIEKEYPDQRGIYPILMNVNANDLSFFFFFVTVHSFFYRLNLKRLNKKIFCKKKKINKQTADDIKNWTLEENFFNDFFDWL